MWIMVLDVAAMCRLVGGYQRFHRDVSPPSSEYTYRNARRHNPEDVLLGYVIWTYPSSLFFKTTKFQRKTNEIALNTFETK
jgi:hypothetical protein